MPVITLETGSEMWFRRSGSGPVLVQIHGSLFGHGNFVRLTPLMQDHFEVIELDLPGYGESRQGPGGGGIHPWADEVAQLVRQLGLGRVHVHGTSLGALVGLSLAARHPDVIDHLVLSCFMCRYDEMARVMRSTWITAAKASGMASVADLTAVAGFSRGFFERSEATAELEYMREAFDRNETAAFVKATESILGLDLEQFVDAVQGPLLLIGGGEDNMTPLAPAASGFGMNEFAARVPHARYEVIPGCGHYMVIEEPAKTAEHILSFIPRSAAHETRGVGR
jgi:3-oxoadipate enol-lactonase